MIWLTPSTVRGWYPRQPWAPRPRNSASERTRCGALVHQILEHRALSLRMDLDAPVLVALAAHVHRAGHVVALDHVSQSQPAHLAAAYARVEEQQNDGRDTI